MTYTLKLLKYFLYFILSYIACVFTLPMITTQAETSINQSIPIYIRTNGVHTDIIMPSKSSLKDWTEMFPYSNTKNNDTTLQNLAIGWGDKGFYLETPSWADLKVSTALKACIGASGSAIHATFYGKMTENETCKKIIISENQYLRLISYIESSLIKKDDKSVHIPTTGLYGKNDAFYEANGRYNIFYSCNTWSNNALKACGQKACLWTVLEQGIFNKYNK